MRTWLVSGTAVAVLASLFIFSNFIPQAVAATSCPALTRTLSFGSRGTDVTALQQFLISQKLLAADSATGYFGMLTQGAVQKFQSQKGVVSSGTPATTGYGMVGARTRAAIKLACGSTTTSTPVTSPAIQAYIKLQCPAVDLPVGKTCAGTWKEVKDAKGCTASWQCQ